MRHPSAVFTKVSSYMPTAVTVASPSKSGEVHRSRSSLGRRPDDQVRQQVPDRTARVGLPEPRVEFLQLLLSGDGTSCVFRDAVGRKHPRCVLRVRCLSRACSLAPIVRSRGSLVATACRVAFFAAHTAIRPNRPRTTGSEKPVHLALAWHPVDWNVSLALNGPRVFRSLKEAT